jgi:hypothetical protein
MFSCFNSARCAQNRVYRSGQVTGGTHRCRAIVSHDCADVDKR